MVRLWQRALRRAGISLAYSKGYNPRPRLSIAVPLALGVTSEAELMDVFIEKQISPHLFELAVMRQLPKGVSVIQVNEVPLSLPSLQSLIRSTEYLVTVNTLKTRKQVERLLNNLLTTTRLPWHHQRDKDLRSYDLRALIYDLQLVKYQDNSCVIGMRLRCDSTGSGRPEQVCLALGFKEAPELIHRTKLIFNSI
jgi:radical SAM-linked protein